MNSVRMGRTCPARRPLRTPQPTPMLNYEEHLAEDVVDLFERGHRLPQPPPPPPFLVNGQRGLYPPDLCVSKMLQIKRGIHKGPQNPEQSFAIPPPPLPLSTPGGSGSARNGTTPDAPVCLLSKVNCNLSGTTTHMGPSPFPGWHAAAGNHLEERLLDQAQARVSYTPPFGGHSRSTPQGRIFDVQPLVKSLF